MEKPMTNRPLRFCFILTTTVLISACATAPHTTPALALETDRQRASYVVGLAQARELAPIMGELYIDIVVQAFRAAHKCVGIRTRAWYWHVRQNVGL